jgi:hypothetical protein
MKDHEKVTESVNSVSPLNVSQVDAGARAHGGQTTNRIHEELTRADTGLRGVNPQEPKNRGRSSSCGTAESMCRARKVTW